MDFLRKKVLIRKINNLGDTNISISAALLFDIYTPKDYYNLIDYCRQESERKEFKYKKKVLDLAKKLCKSFETIESLNLIFNRNIDKDLMLHLKDIFITNGASENIGLTNFLLIGANLNETQKAQFKRLNECLLIYCSLVNSWNLEDVTGVYKIGLLQQELRKET